MKRLRGRPHDGSTIGLSYWKRWCQGGEKDTSIQLHLKAMQIEYKIQIEHTKGCENGKKREILFLEVDWIIRELHFKKSNISNLLQHRPLSPSLCRAPIDDFEKWVSPNLCRGRQSFPSPAWIWTFPQSGSSNLWRFHLISISNRRGSVH